MLSRDPKVNRIGKSAGKLLFSERTENVMKELMKFQTIDLSFVGTSVLLRGVIFN